MKQYLDLLRAGLNGTYKGDRTGTGTTSIFGYQMRFDLNVGFPLCTTKKLYLRAIIHELLWFLKGDTNNESLRAMDVHIWDEWALAEDVIEEVRLTDLERLALYAQSKDVDLEKAKKVLHGMYVVYRTTTIDLNRLSEIEYGHRVMDEAGIATTRNKVVRAKGDLGPIYGKQWRSWEGSNGKTFDQIAWVIEELKRNPDSRRLVVSAWNVEDLDKMALNPCHTMFQFYALPMSLDDRFRHASNSENLTNEQFEEIKAVWKEYGRAGEVFRKDSAAESQTVLEAKKQAVVDALDRHGVPSRRLSCQLYQRSMDIFLGGPFNIASYAILTHMVAQVVNMDVGDFVHTIGDAHVYSNHVHQASLQLQREPKPLPKLWLNPEIRNIDDFTFDDIRVIGYESHPAIKAPVAV